MSPFCTPYVVRERWEWWSTVAVHRCSVILLNLSHRAAVTRLPDSTDETITHELHCVVDLTSSEIQVRHMQGDVNDNADLCRNSGGASVFLATPESRPGMMSTC